MKHNMFDVSW